MPFSTTSAILRRDDAEGGISAYWKFIIGPFLLLVSDSIIAHLKFHDHEHIPMSGFLIMITYYVGQTLIFSASSFNVKKIDHREEATSLLSGYEQE